MTPRDHLHQLVDELRDDELDDAARYLKSLRTDAGLARAEDEADIAARRTISHQEIRPESSWAGARANKAPPADTLKEWHWLALAKAYAAGADGLEGSYGNYASIGWNTWLQLRDYKPDALVDEKASGAGSNPETETSGTVFRLRITSAGRALYERERASHPESRTDP